MSRQSIILHLDMNSYFASVEQQANPHLRGKPIGVCEHLGGIIIAPSVEAKRLGIKLGTPVWEARKICPSIVLLPVDPDKYRHITMSFLRILMDYTDDVDKASIDEAFADFTSICRNFDEALLLGLEIKQRLRYEIGEWISCSIGIGPNKLLAKIAADLGEGDIDRICVIKPEEVMSLYDRLDLTDIPGIAKRTEIALNQVGIFTLYQLACYPLANLINLFGINGYFLHQLANFNFPFPREENPLLHLPFDPSTSLRAGKGEKERVWKPLTIGRKKTEEIKSIGHSYTLPRAISNLREIKKLMFKLAEKIGRRMRRKKFHGMVIHYFHSDKCYHGFGRQQKIKEFINDGRDIYKVAWQIFLSSMRSSTPSRFRAGLRSDNKDFLFPERIRHRRRVERSIKIMGISVSGLQFNYQKEPLFEQYKKPVFLLKAMDLINDKYGEFTIRRGRLLDIPPEWAKDTVGFGRMKEFFIPACQD